MGLVPLIHHQILWLNVRNVHGAGSFFIWVPHGSCMGPLPTATNYLLCTWQELHSLYKYTLLYLLCKYTVSIIRLSHFLFSVPWICFTCIQFHSVLRIIRIHIFLSVISHLFHLIRRISFLPFFSDVQTESISKYSSPLQQQQITIYTIFILSTSFPIQKG